MIPLKTHQVWFGGKMPTKLGAWRFDLMAQNPHLEHKLWTENNVHELGLDFAQLQNDFPSLAGVSNVVRLKAVLDHGGMYCDCDFEPLKPLYSLFELRGPAVAPQENDRLCNAWFIAPKGDAWVRWQYERVGQYKGVAAFWGVDLMTAAPRDGLMLIPRETVYPWLFDDAPEKRVHHPSSLMAHHWEGSWLKKP